MSFDTDIVVLALLQGAQVFVFIFSFALAGAGGVTVPFPV